MSQIGMSFKLAHDVVPASKGVRLMHMLIKVDASNAPLIEAPMAVAIVVDKSESMMLPMLTQEQVEELRRHGVLRDAERDGVRVIEFMGFSTPSVLRDAPRPFDFVKRALRAIVEHLNDYDMFSLIAFATDARTVLPMCSGEAREKMFNSIEVLERLRLGDGTELSKGLELAYEELSKTASEQMLRRTIIITDGYCIDESRCIDLGRHMADDGIRISTMGVGINFNEDLMTRLADASGGEAFFVPDPSQIPEALGSEMRQSRLVALCQAVLKLHLPRGVEIRKAYMVRPTVTQIERIYSSSAQLVELRIGELKPTVYEFLIELLLPPRSDGLYRIAHISLQGVSRERFQTEVASVDVTLRYLSGASLGSPNEEVMQAASIASAAELQMKALQDLKANDVASATVKLRAAKTRLLSTGASTAHIDEILSEVERSGQASPHSTKRLRYETRRLTSSEP